MIKILVYKCASQCSCAININGCLIIHHVLNQTTESGGETAPKLNLNTRVKKTIVIKTVNGKRHEKRNKIQKRKP